MRYIFKEYLGLDISEPYHALLILLGSLYAFNIYFYKNASHVFSFSVFLVIVYAFLHIHKYKIELVGSRVYREFGAFVLNVTILASLFSMFSIVLSGIVIPFLKPYVALIVGSKLAGLIIVGVVVVSVLKFFDFIKETYYDPFILPLVSESEYYFEGELDELIEKDINSNPNKYTIDFLINKKIYSINAWLRRLFLLTLVFAFFGTRFDAINIVHYVWILTFVFLIYFIFGVIYVEKLRNNTEPYDKEARSLDIVFIELLPKVGVLMLLAMLIVTIGLNLLPDSFLLVNDKGKIISMSDDAKLYTITSFVLISSPIIYRLFLIIVKWIILAIAVPVIYTYSWVKYVLLPLIGMLVIFALAILMALAFIGAAINIFALVIQIGGALFITLLIFTFITSFFKK